MKHAITSNNLCHKYDKTPVLNNITFSVPKGSFFIIIGPNGSGKTTLLKLISRIKKIQSGTLDIFETPINKYSRKDLAKTIAFVPQTIPVDFPFSVEEIVLLGRSPHLGLLGIEHEQDYKIAKKAMAFTETEHLLDRKLDQLSGGERQRVFISKAISQEPKIILLDEPTAFLDISHKYEIIHLLRTLSRDYNKTIVFSTHDLASALREADKIWLFNEREIVEGSPEDLVLTGKLSDALLDESSTTGVALDMESGEFKLQRKMHGWAKISSSDEMLKRWTCKALERLGYNTESNKSGGINVIVNRKDGILIWILEENSNKLEFKSIYELSLYLRTHI